MPGPQEKGSYCNPGWIGAISGRTITAQKRREERKQRAQELRDGGKGRTSRGGRTGSPCCRLPKLGIVLFLSLCLGSIRTQADVRKGNLGVNGWEWQTSQRSCKMGHSRLPTSKVGLQGWTQVELLDFCLGGTWPGSPCRHPWGLSSLFPVASHCHPWLGACWVL